MLTNEERQCLFDLLMVSDPWPLSNKARQVMEDLGDKEAKAMGFKDWLEAYHYMEED